MTFKQTVNLQCDYPDCGKTYTYSTSMPLNLREWAQSYENWSIEADEQGELGDRCPEHNWLHQYKLRINR